MQDKILVLGSTSWLGYLLLEELSIKIPQIPLASTIYKNKLDFNFNVKLFHASNSQDYNSILNEFQPTVIVNFLRGEDDNGMLLHKALINYAEKTEAYYIYASSALALDAYSGIELTENILANGKSDYGLFKAKCEQALYDSTSKWCILRFASVQGWVHHKLTRNENLLKNLSKGEKIIVDSGVYQNRMLANLMIKGIVNLIVFKTEGIIHFGTIDSSDEVNFLQKQAELFGYSSKLIERSPVDRNVNLVCVPNRIFNILGESYRVSEKDTLQNLSEITALKKYIKL
jgi:dTDP-4-dehydrorhamnose reductase